MATGPGTGTAWMPWLSVCAALSGSATAMASRVAGRA